MMRTVLGDDHDGLRPRLDRAAEDEAEGPRAERAAHLSRVPDFVQVIAVRRRGSPALLRRQSGMGRRAQDSEERSDGDDNSPRGRTKSAPHAFSPVMW